MMQSQTFKKKGHWREHRGVLSTVTRSDQEAWITNLVTNDLYIKVIGKELILEDYKRVWIQCNY